MSKSIIIFGKGPSVLRCTKEFVNKYDDIAICNYPVLNDFFMNLIKDKKEIKYHFANCGTFDERYNDEINKKLNIKELYNTNKRASNHYLNYISDKKLFKGHIREPLLKYFKDNFDLDPNTGIMGLQFILNTNQYNKIALVGFDNFKKGEQKYYFKPKDYNKKIKYLIDQNTITKEGVYNQICLHCPIKTQKYIEHVFRENQNISFEMISNIQFKSAYNNFTPFNI